MKRQHTQMQSSSASASGVDALDSPSYQNRQYPQQLQAGKGKETMADAGLHSSKPQQQVDRELASMGYSVRSSDLMQVAHKLEQLEMMMCSTQEEGLTQLASDTVHYNPSDLAGWVEHMLSGFHGPNEGSCSKSNKSMPTESSASTTSSAVIQNPYDFGGLYEAAAAAELGLDGSEFLYTGGGPAGGFMMTGLEELLAGTVTADPSCLMMDPSGLIQSSSSNNTCFDPSLDQKPQPLQLHPKDSPPGPSLPQSTPPTVKKQNEEEKPKPQLPKEETEPVKIVAVPKQEQFASSPPPPPPPPPHNQEEKQREKKRPRRAEPDPIPTDRPMVMAADDDPQESGVRLVHTLMACAEAIQQENLSAAGKMVKEIKTLASTQGGAMSKVARHFAEALARRICGFPTNDMFLMQNDALSETLHFYFYETCPYLKFAHFTANQAILEAFAGQKQVHVIDFNLKQGMQWPVLLQALALRPGGPPVVRLTGIGPPTPDSTNSTDGLQEVGMKLTEFARTLNVEFHFRCYAVLSLRDIKPWLLNISPGEAVAVNSIMQLHRLLAVPGGLEEVLHLIRSLKPKIVTLVEQEANHNKPVFLERFTEALHYYSTVFDSLEACGLPQMSDEQVMSEIYLGREICNIVACEGAERVERHEPLMLWRLRMYNAGFRAVHLGSNAFKQVSMLLQLYSGGDGFRIEENNGCLTLGWHSRPLIAASAWQCC